MLVSQHHMEDHRMTDFISNADNQIFNRQLPDLTESQAQKDENFLITSLFSQACEE